MPLLGTVLGWSGMGFAARCWQLAIMKRNIFDNMGGHALSVGFFGTLGFAYYHADQRVLELLEDKKQELRAIRQAQTQGASDGGDEE